MIWQLIFWSSEKPRNPGEELIRLFIERLKEALEIPILDAWADVLWKQARNRKYVQELNIGGDCILGAKIDLQADWQELLVGTCWRKKAIA